MINGEEVPRVKAGIYRAQANYMGRVWRNKPTEEKPPQPYLLPILSKPNNLFTP